MLDRVRVLFIAILLSLFTVNIFAASADLSDKYLTKATEAYEADDIENAYKYVNAALKLQKADSINPKVTYLAQSIYTIKLEELLKSYDELVFIDVSENLNNYPDVANAKIKKLLKQIESSQENKKEKLEQQRFNQQKEMMSKQAEAMEKQSEVLEKQSQAMAKQAENSAKQTEALTNTMQQMSESFNQNAAETKKSTKLIVLAIFGISIFVFIVVFMIILLIRRSMKNQQASQEQVAMAFRFLAESQNTTNKLMLGGVTDIYGSNPTLRLAGSSTWSATQAAGLPLLDISADDEDEIKKLAVKCEEIGGQIDQATGRKNNSKNVSEIVYKLSMQLGLPQGMALLNFCASMIYDAGFLGLDQELLSAEVLTDEQKKAMKEHVNLAEKYLDFVPKKYWSVFEDAALKHHENMDGTGYPQGLKGDEIPQIARLIRVAETYVSMSSRRQYRETMDKETAINKLKEQPNLYDTEVVEALDQII